MKAGEVLKLLRISRPTLSKYVKLGFIKTKRGFNGQYVYDGESVYKFLNDGKERITVVYGRVSTQKQKNDLDNQLDLLRNFCFSNGWKVSQTFSDIASGISFEKRASFFELLDAVIAGKIERVVITHKDRLSRVGFDLFKFLFQKYSTEIVVMSDVGNTKLDSEEIFEEIISLLHCYSMKLYSKRRCKKIKEVLEETETEE